MNQPIFRKTSMDKVSSPEQLNDYIKVTNPSVWITLASIMILLAAVVIWGIFGVLETKASEVGICENGILTCYVSDISDIREGMTVYVGNLKGEITYVSQNPFSMEYIESGYTDKYVQYALNLSEWNYSVTVSVPELKDGISEVEIVIDSVSPLSFLFN